MAELDTDAVIRTTDDAIRVAQRLLTEAEAHSMLRSYQPDDPQFAHEVRKCLTLAHVAIALALDIESGDAEGGQ
jgi:hypothetical protein